MHTSQKLHFSNLWLYQDLWTESVLVANGSNRGPLLLHPSTIKKKKRRRRKNAFFFFLSNTFFYCYQEKLIKKLKKRSKKIFYTPPLSLSFQHRSKLNMMDVISLSLLLFLPPLFFTQPSFSQIPGAIFILRRAWIKRGRERGVRTGWPGRQKKQKNIVTKKGQKLNKAT